MYVGEGGGYLPPQPTSSNGPYPLVTWKGGFRVSRPKQKSALIAQTIVILKEKNEEKKTQSNFIFLAEGQIDFLFYFI